MISRSNVAPFLWPIYSERNCTPGQVKRDRTAEISKHRAMNMDIRPSQLNFFASRRTRACPASFEIDYLFHLINFHAANFDFSVTSPRRIGITGWTMCRGFSLNGFGYLASRYGVFKFRVKLYFAGTEIVVARFHSVDG